MGESLPGSAGVPPAQVLAQPRLSSPPGSKGNAPRALLQLGPYGSADRAGGCNIAGKLSGTQRQCMRAGRPRSRVGARSHHSCSSRGARRLAGLQPCRYDRTVSLRGPSGSLVDHSFFRWRKVSIFCAGKEIVQEAGISGKSSSARPLRAASLGRDFPERPVCKSDTTGHSSDL